MKHDRPAYAAKPDCRCRTCRAERVAQWRALGAPMRNLLIGLAQGPRLWRDLRANQRVTDRTLNAAVKAGLVTFRDYREGPLLLGPMIPFVIPSNAGRIMLYSLPASERKAV